MAVFIFENTTQAEAATFDGTDDILVFSNANVNARSVSVTPSTGDTLTNAGITITVGDKSLTFAADELSEASQDGRIFFDDGSSLRLGSQASETLNGTANNANDPTDDVLYGFAGADILNGNDGHDYLYGGTNSTGNDVLNGGTGNDHLYGNALTTTQGQTDGDDILNGGDGADYLQGNAGADQLNGDAGSDRLYGGNGNDVISGGTGADTVNGNVGNDVINGDGGNDILRGGQGNDLISGGDDTASIPAGNGPDGVPGGGDDTPSVAATTSNDILYGDLGADTLDGGTGLDVLFGGDGADIFLFSGADSPVGRIGATSGSNVDVVDVIADYVDGTDEIRLGFNVATEGGVVRDTTGTTFGTLSAAQTYAQQLLDNSTATTAEVAAVRFGNDTYLFYNSAGGAAGTVDSAIKILGLSDPTLLTAADFNG